MILSDGDIRRRLEAGDLVIEPLEDPELQIQPASVDFRLGREFLEFERTNISCIHPDSADEVAQYVSRTRVPPDDQATLEGFDGPDEADRVNDEFILHPGDFVLGTTIERVELPNDLIAHVEGRSSLGRLAVVVHASLPYDEPVFLWTPGSGFGFHAIGEVVERRVPARAVAFDPTTLRVRTHEVTDYITNPAKRIYRVTLESGRRVHVTRDHNLFTLDATGRVVRVASEDAEGTLVMVPGTLPAPATPETELDPFGTSARRSGVTDSSSADITRPGAAEVGKSASGRPDESPWREPLDDRAGSRVAGSIALAAERCEGDVQREVPVTPEFGWLFGFYVSAGTAAPGQLEFRNVNPASLDRVTRWFERRDPRPAIVDRGSGERGLTIRSDHWSAFFRALAGTGQEKHLLDDVWNWSNDVLVALLGGLVDGSDFREDERDTVYTTDAELASRTMYLATRVGLSSSVTAVERSTTPRFDDGPVGGPSWAVELAGGAPESDQRLPVPDDLLRSMRERSGLGPRQATDGGDSSASASPAQLERGDAETVRRSDLRRLRERYDGTGADVRRLDQLLDGDVRFERVTSVEATDRFETTYDLEVQPGGRAIENFIGGRGGVFLSNTAGIVDPGYRGQITLELSNLGSAPVALRPGMRISQLTFTELTSPADRPYGAGRGSKYQDQTGPQASRIQGDEEFGGDQR